MTNSDLCRPAIAVRRRQRIEYSTTELRQRLARDGFGDLLEAVIVAGCHRTSDGHAREGAPQGRTGSRTRARVPAAGRATILVQLRQAQRRTERRAGVVPGVVAGVVECMISLRRR